jgi:hypothetical protein
MPGTYLTHEFFDSLNIPYDLHTVASLAVINGSQSHEALHCLLTVFGFIEAAMETGDDEIVQFAREFSLFHSVYGIVEDIYIERYAKEFFPTNYEFILAKNEVLFGDHTIRMMVERSEQAAQNGNANTLAELFSWSAYAKNPRMANHPEVQARVGSVIKIYERARHLDIEPAERVRIGFEAFIELCSLASDSPQQEMEFNEFMSMLMGIDDPTLQGLLAELFMKLATSAGSSDPFATKIIIRSEDFEEASEEFEEEVEEKIAREKAASEKRKIEKEIEKQNTKALSVFEHIPPTEYIEIFNAIPERSGFTSVASIEWERLGNHLRYARAPREIATIPDNRGSKLLRNRLSHIVIDGKVLSDPDLEEEESGEPETILAIDASGSMWSRSSRHGETKSVYDAGSRGFRSLFQIKNDI